MLFMNANDIMRALPLEAVMDCVEEALRIYEAQTYEMPDRLAVDCGEDNVLLLMPSVAKGYWATKLVTVFPGNRILGKPVIDGLVALGDQATGEILALMDGKTITAMRTGAVTGTSIRHLARRDAVSVGLVGCGVQGYYQLLYACAARAIRQITLYDISVAAISSLAAKLGRSLPGVEVRVAESTAELAQVSDILITATTARVPVFPDDPELFRGKHCVAIGSFEPEVREYPDALFSLVEKVWIDIDFAVEESGELMIPLQQGSLREGQLETLGHFIQSGQPPARGPSGTTFFKTVGMALFDLTTARLAYANAMANGLGTQLDR
jgi:ornithine cyclodeaminase/alanine dehydrogenase-like protein (mu-crystallin family)